MDGDSIINVIDIITLANIIMNQESNVRKN